MCIATIESIDHSQSNRSQLKFKKDFKEINKEFYRNYKEEKTLLVDVCCGW